MALNIVHAGNYTKMYLDKLDVIGASRCGTKMYKLWVRICGLTIMSGRVFIGLGPVRRVGVNLTSRNPGKPNVIVASQ